MSNLVETMLDTTALPKKGGRFQQTAQRTSPAMAAKSTAHTRVEAPMPEVVR